MPRIFYDIPLKEEDIDDNEQQWNIGKLNLDTVLDYIVKLNDRGLLLVKGDIEPTMINQNDVRRHEKT